MISLEDFFSTVLPLVQSFSRFFCFTNAIMVFLKTSICYFALIDIIRKMRGKFLSREISFKHSGAFSSKNILEEVNNWIFPELLRRCIHSKFVSDASLSNFSKLQYIFFSQ